MSASDTELDADTEITLPDHRWVRCVPPAQIDASLNADQIVLALDAGDEPTTLILRILRLRGIDLEVVADALRRREHPIAGDYLTALLQFVHTEGSVALRDGLVDELSEHGLGRIVDDRVADMSRYDRLVSAILCSEGMTSEDAAAQLVEHLIALPLVALVGGVVRRDALGPAAQRLAEWLGIDAVRDLVRFVRLADDARSDRDLRASGRCFARAVALIAPELLAVQLARLRRHLAG